MKSDCAIISIINALNELLYVLIEKKNKIK